MSAAPGPECLTEDHVLAHLAGRTSPALSVLIQRHVERCSPCRRLLAAVVISQRSPNRPTLAPGEARVLADGERVGDRYQVQRLVARGGMGEVYEARDGETGTIVALKTLACTALDDASSIVRFRAEVALAEKVRHPNVCPILGHGVHKRQSVTTGTELVPYLLMPFLHGTSLTGRLREQGPLERPAAAKLLLALLAGVEAVHAAAIVHRDLKSENVFLVAEPGGERVLLMDFGVARATDGSVLSTWPKRTTIAGTPPCMAPEQLLGNAPTPATDVYGLGVIIFETVTGERPFTDVDPLEKARLPAPLPSRAAPGVDPRWDPIVARCLASDPLGRYPTVTALAADIAPLATP